MSSVMAKTLGMWHDQGMDDLKKLAQRWRRADVALQEARRTLAEALLAAAEANVPQKDVVAETGINRETIRLMVEKARKERAKQAAELENSTGTT